MIRKRIDLSLLLFVIIVSTLMAIMMQSVVFLYIDDTYDPNYYIYQIVLYLVAGIIVFRNRRKVKTNALIKFMWAFGIMCFLFSFVQLEVFSPRTIGALFFNSFIIPLSFLNGFWFGNRLSYLKDRDLYLLLFQIPAFFAMYLLYSFNSLGNWFDADAAFCVIVFFPFIFFFKREWMSVLLAMFYVVFTLVSAKRSIIIFVVVCLTLFLFYLMKNRRWNSRTILSNLYVFGAFIVGAYLVLNNESSVLLHMRERIEVLGGIDYDNGRYDIYNTVSKAIYNSDMLSFFCGHGNSAVKRDFDVGAHNDLLEIGYDYGVLSVVVYLCIFFVIVIKTLRYYRQKNYLSAMRVGLCVTSIVIMGMLNCLITSSVLEYILFLALGSAMGLNESRFQVSLKLKIT